jgi:hypothetical protein
MPDPFLINGCAGSAPLDLSQTCQSNWAVQGSNRTTKCEECRPRHRAFRTNLVHRCRELATIPIRHDNIFQARGSTMAKQPRLVHQMTVAPFEKAFPDEEACRAYLIARR